VASELARVGVCSAAVFPGAAAQPNGSKLPRHKGANRFLAFGLAERRYLEFEIHYTPDIRHLA